MSIKEGIPTKIKFKEFNLYDDILNINKKVYSPLNFKQLYIGNKIIELNPKPIQKSPFEFTKRHIPTIYEKMGEAIVRAQNMDVYQKQIFKNINEDFIQKQVAGSLDKNTQNPQTPPNSPQEPPNPPNSPQSPPLTPHFKQFGDNSKTKTSDNFSQTSDKKTLDRHTNTLKIDTNNKGNNTSIDTTERGTNMSPMSPKGDDIVHDLNDLFNKRFDINVPPPPKKEEPKKDISKGLNYTNMIGNVLNNGFNTVKDIVKLGDKALDKMVVGNPEVKTNHIYKEVPVGVPYPVDRVVYRDVPVRVYVPIDPLPIQAQIQAPPARLQIQAPPERLQIEAPPGSPNSPIIHKTQLTQRTRQQLEAMLTRRNIPFNINMNKPELIQILLNDPTNNISHRGNPNYIPEGADRRQYHSNRADRRRRNNQLF